MRRLLKIFLLLLSLSLALAIFVGCGGDEENEAPVTYSVTLTDSGGSGIADAIVKFKIGNSVKEKRTNIAGVASIEVAYADLSLAKSAEIVELPDGYTCEAGVVAYTDGQTNISFTASSVEKYTVNVLADGSAVEGARIRIFVGEEELQTGFTDMYGKLEVYIPSTASTVSAKLLSAPGYVLSGDNTLSFGADKSVTFTVTEQVSYTVNTLDIYHRAVAGVKISVYTLGGALVDVKTVTNTGSVTFNLDKTEYYLTVEVINPSITCIQGEEVNGEGERRVSINAATSNRHTLEFVQTDAPIEYKVAVKNASGAVLSGVSVNLYSRVHELVATAVSDADGFARFNVPNGTYIAVAMPTDMTSSADAFNFIADGAVLGEIMLKAERAGKDSASAAMLYDNEYNKVYVPMGASSWYYVPNGINRTVVINAADGITVKYNNRIYAAEGGVITVVLESAAGKATIEVINGGTENKTLSLSVNKKGTLKNPIALELNKNIEIQLSNGEVVYYSFTADGNKTLDFTYTGSHSDLAAVFVGGVAVERIVLKSGETVVFALAASNYEGGSVSYTAKASFEERYIDYTVNVQIENSDVLSGIRVQLLRDGVAVPGMLVTTNADGEAVFANILEYSGYSVEIVDIQSGYEVVNKNATFTDNQLGVSITLIPCGTLESPYDVIIGENQTYTDFNAGEVWFEINVRGVSEYLLEIIVNSGSIQIYDAKDGSALLTVSASDGRITYVFNDTSSATPLDEGVYFIKLSTEESSVTVGASSAGYSPELPQKIGEAGEYVATVKDDGGIVYYEYTGALKNGDTVTVKVENTAALSVNGQTAASGEYTFTYDGGKILFEISADTADNYDFTITVQ